MKTYRQGDVLLVKVSAIPNDVKDLDADADKFVLAYGEVTGHAHALDMDNVRFVVNEQTQQRYLDIKKISTLRHEEHNPIELPSGYYEVIIQREYDGTYSRPVVD